MTNPFARTIIIQPRYLERTACKSRKNDSEMSEFKETTVVIIDINKKEKINRGLLKLFIFVGSDLI